MYYMKNIINHNEEIILPKCMYIIKNPNESLSVENDQINLNISNQSPRTKMAELQQRQEKLIEKLDFLYARIKTISTYCESKTSEVKIKAGGSSKALVPNPEEVVLVVNPDNLPYYLIKILKSSCILVNLNWHIHSSVPNEKVPKIKSFVKHFKNTDKTSKINLRLIFKSATTDSELKLSSLSMPIVGTVNILRYLSLAYPTVIPYDGADFKMDSLLDICHLLEKSFEKNKEQLLKKLFSDSQDFILGNEFTIVDLAAFNVVKQSNSTIKYVPKTWFAMCEKLCS